MVKWSDYAIIAVKYDEEKKHIDEVKVRTDNGTELTNEQNMLRSKVISLLENETTFVTSIKKNNKWKKGDNVGIVEINKTKFIRTDGNSVEEDNLGELPEF